MSESVSLRIWNPDFRPERGAIARELFGAGKDVVVSAGKGFRNGSAVLLRGGPVGEGVRHSSSGAARGSALGAGALVKALGIGLGHASIRLPDTFIGYWSPDEDEGEIDCVAMTEADEDDIIDRPPDHVIDLTGLDVPAMEEAWERALATPYDLRNHNCCTVCYRAIEAGRKAMNRKRLERAGVLDVLRHLGSGMLRMATNPSTTLDAFASEFSAEELITWNPVDLLNYSKYVREVVIG